MKNHVWQVGEFRYSASFIFGIMVAFLLVFGVALAMSPGSGSAAALPHTASLPKKSSGAGAIYYSRVTTPTDNIDSVFSSALDGSNEQLITVGDWPRLSPNGQYLAFDRYKGNSTYAFNRNLYTRDLTSNTEALIQDSADYLVNYTFNADSSQVIYDYLSYQFRKNSDGTGVATQFPFADGFDDAPQMAPPGTPMSGTIVMQNFNTGLILMNSDGSNRRVLTNTVATDIYPVWSADGEWISFGYSMSQNIIQTTSYYKIHPDGSNLTLLASIASGCSDILSAGAAWTPDGAYVVLPGTVAGVDGIYAIPSNGSQALLQINVPSGPRPDFVGAVTGSIVGTPVHAFGCAPTPTSTVAPTSTSTITAQPSATPTTCVLNFTDVDPAAWFYPYVNYMYCHGVVNGYSASPPCTSGTPCFKPENNTIRGQMAKIVVLAFNFPINTTGGPHFSDVPTTHTFFPYIETGYNLGLFGGYSDGTYRPGSYITRGQIAKIVVNAAILADSANWTLLNPSTSIFEDVGVGSDFFQYVETAYAHGVINGYLCGSAPDIPCVGPDNKPYFLASARATRAQICKITYLAVTNQPRR